MKKINIFGSTGSIGQNALDVIRKDRDSFSVLGLCTYRNVKKLYQQIEEFRPSYVCVVDERSADNLKSLAKKIKIFKGPKGMEEFASIDCDISLMAISGISALRPFMMNIGHAKKIALANKESIVTAGNFIFDKANRFKTQILPVDSEINAIFQLASVKNNFDKVYLTASGGALFDYGKKDLAGVCARKVLSHPTWRMGKRITVDSATLLNKGFEVIEAHHFFDLNYKDIGIVIHRESTVHAFVEFKDKTLFACIYPPDMRLPISFALNYPKRVNASGGIGFKNSFSLSFQPLEIKRFPLLEIILEAARRKDNSPTVLNACDEIAVEYFLANRIKFTDIHKAMGYIFSHYKSSKLKRLEDIFFWDKWSREKTKEYLEKL